MEDSRHLPGIRFGVRCSRAVWCLPTVGAAFDLWLVQVAAAGQAYGIEVTGRISHADRLDARLRRTPPNPGEPCRAMYEARLVRVVSAQLGFTALLRADPDIVVGLGASAASTGCPTHESWS